MGVGVIVFTIVVTAFISCLVISAINESVFKKSLIELMILQYYNDRGIEIRNLKIINYSENKRKVSYSYEERIKTPDENVHEYKKFSVRGKKFGIIST